MALDDLTDLAARGVGPLAEASLGKKERGLVGTISFARLPRFSQRQYAGLLTIFVLAFTMLGTSMMRPWRVAFSLIEPSFEFGAYEDGELTVGSVDLVLADSRVSSCTGVTLSTIGIEACRPDGAFDADLLEDRSIAFGSQHQLYVYDSYRLHEKLWVAVDDGTPVEAAIAEHPDGQVWWIRRDLPIFDDIVSESPQTIDLRFGYEKKSLDYDLRVAIETSRDQERDVSHSETFRDCAECPELVALPGGVFHSRSESQIESWHNQTISPFAIGKFEVTFDEWDACADDGGCNPAIDDEGWGRGNRPIVNVSWLDAQNYLGWLSSKTGQVYRLPSEDEFEYAGLAGASTSYSWGNEVQKGRANCRDDICGDGFVDETAPVGSFEPNDFGLYDMHGNAFEWIRDSSTELSRFEGLPLEETPQVDDSLEFIVGVMGGSFFHGADEMDLSGRYSGLLSARFTNQIKSLGSRVVRELTP